MVWGGAAEGPGLTGALSQMSFVVAAIFFVGTQKKNARSSDMDNKTYEVTLDGSKNLVKPMYFYTTCDYYSDENNIQGVYHPWNPQGNQTKAASTQLIANYKNKECFPGDKSLGVLDGGCSYCMPLNAYDSWSPYLNLHSALNGTRVPKYNSCDFGTVGMDGKKDSYIPAAPTEAQWGESALDIKCAYTPATIKTLLDTKDGYQILREKLDLDTTSLETSLVAAIDDVRGKLNCMDCSNNELVPQTTKDEKRSGKETYGTNNTEAFNDMMSTYCMKPMSESVPVKVTVTAVNENTVDLTVDSAKDLNKIKTGMHMVTGRDGNNHLHDFGTVSKTTNTTITINTTHTNSDSNGMLRTDNKALDVTFTFCPLASTSATDGTSMKTCSPVHAFADLTGRPHVCTRWFKDVTRKQKDADAAVQYTKAFCDQQGDAAGDCDCYHLPDTNVTASNAAGKLLPSHCWYPPCSDGSKHYFNAYNGGIEKSTSTSECPANVCALTLNADGYNNKTKTLNEIITKNTQNCSSSMGTSGTSGTKPLAPWVLPVSIASGVVVFCTLLYGLVAYIRRSRAASMRR